MSSLVPFPVSPFTCSRSTASFFFFGFGMVGSASVIGRRPEAAPLGPSLATILIVYLRTGGFF